MKKFWQLRQTTRRQTVFNTLRRWKQIDISITEAFNEAKDNVKYLTTLEKFIEPLYSGTPSQIIDTLPALLNSVTMIHTIARYYNTSERITNLFSKITNQMINNCRTCIIGECEDASQLWDTYPPDLIGHLDICLKLNESYQEQYNLTKNKLMTLPKGKQFDFNESLIFGRFDLFCRRVVKLIHMFSTVHQFNQLKIHLKSMDGIHQLVGSFQTIVDDFKFKSHDLLDFLNNRFDRDYVEFNVRISELESALQDFINQSFQNIASIDTSLKLLSKFQGILQHGMLRAMAVVALLCGIVITVDCGTLEPDTGWPPTENHIELFEDLGNLSFPVEASSLAQRYFDQGFRFIAAFDFRRAVISFRAAQIVDPGCIMCIWGESFALGPNLNSFDEPRLLQSLPLAYEKAQQAGRMSALKSYDRARSTANRVEIGLVRSLLTRYKAAPEDYVAQEHELTHAFADEMAHVLADLDGGPKSHPNIAALVADAWMNTQPWNYWEPSGRMRQEAEQALQILQQALLSNPRHAFCVHLYVHVTEASGKQSLLHLARPFAELLPNLMPGAPHLVHMSFHTLMHTGDFYVADVDNGRASSLPRQIYPMHNLDTLSWVCRIQGRSACSLDAAKSLEHLALPLVGTGVFETGFPPARFASVWPLTLLAFGRLTAITSAQLPEQCKLDPVLGGMWHFAKGAALSKQGYVSRAREELEQLQQERLRIQARMAIPAGMAWQNFHGSKDWAVYPADAVLRLASLELKAHVARAEHADELSAWKEALMAEAELPYDEPPAWYLPVANRFGEALARLGHAEEADRLWQKSLSILPHNGWALFGLVQLCLNSTSSASDCAQLETKFNRSWRHADVVLSDPADVCVLPARASDAALSLSSVTRLAWVAVAAGVILASVGCSAGICRLASIPCNSCAYYRLPDEESALPRLKTDLESKFAVIFHNYGQELEALKDFYEKHRVSPQIVRNMPPVAGNIMWSRQLLHRIMEPMQKFHHNPLVVAGGKEAKRVIKIYNKMAKTLVEFEIVWHQAWVSSIETTKAGLNATLLTKLPEDQKSYYVNFDPEILQLIRETKCLDRMGHVEIPESARMLLLQEEKCHIIPDQASYDLHSAVSEIA
eukprot:s629_g9.t3